jgi:hypothetical protein
MADASRAAFSLPDAALPHPERDQQKWYAVLRPIAL